jgi:hypothetical protein
VTTRAYLKSRATNRGPRIARPRIGGNGSRATDRAGTDRAGTDRAGTDRAGTDRAGTDRAGTDRAGFGSCGDGVGRSVPVKIGGGPAKYELAGPPFDPVVTLRISRSVRGFLSPCHWRVRWVAPAVGHSLAVRSRSPCGVRREISTGVWPCAQGVFGNEFCGSGVSRHICDE